jgi:hypothetical protein
MRRSCSALRGGAVLVYDGEQILGNENTGICFRFINFHHQTTPRTLESGSIYRDFQKAFTIQCAAFVSPLPCMDIHMQQETCKQV